MNHFYSHLDVADPDLLIERALEIKKNPLKNPKPGKDKTMLMLFFNASLRTRLSTQKAAQNLGLQVISMNIDEGWNLETEEGAVMNLDKAEHIRDAARVMGQYADVIGIRSFPQLKDRDEDQKDLILRSFINYAGVPVINLESALYHPLQSLADYMTIAEIAPGKPLKIVLTWAPHPRSLPHSVVNSFLAFGQLTRHEIMVCNPPGYDLKEARTLDIPVLHNQDEALKGADIVYAKNWSATEPYGQVLSTDSSWMIDDQKMKLTREAKFMHCLPVRRNVVVSDEVIDGPHSIVYAQAANREFAAQAVIEKILENPAK